MEQVESADILIVEDEIIIADQIAMILERIGHNALPSVPSGEEALEQLEQEPTPDLILLDIYLSGEIDGFQTAARIAELYQIPVVFITSNPDTSHAKRLQIPGIYGYLKKPVQPDELHRALQHAFYKSKLDRDLRSNEAWLDHILTNIHDGVVVLDDKHHVLYANTLARQLFDQEEFTRESNIDQMLKLTDIDSGKRVNIGHLTHKPNHEYRLRVDHKNQQKSRFIALRVSVTKSDSINLILLMREISEELRLEQELTKSHSQLRDLNRRLIQAQENERKRIAQELHDDLGQYLLRLRMDIKATERELEAMEHPPEKLEHRLEVMQDLIQTAVSIIKNMTNAMRPQLIEYFGLKEAVDDLAKRITSEHDLDVKTRFDTDLEGLDYELSIDLFRIIQEAITNALKHANANTLTISCYSDIKDLILTLKDDGDGFEPGKSTKNDSLGLVGMRERILRWNGILDISSDNSSGTTIRIRIPDYEQYKVTTG